MKIKRTILLDFKGYYRDGATLPDYSGLYFVYKGIPTKPGKCRIIRLLYIGQAENINDRVGTDHEHYEDWKQELGHDEILYYSVCPVDAWDLDMTEAACIYKTQPPVNKQCKETYNHAPARIISSGPAEFLPSQFDIE